MRVVKQYHATPETIKKLLEKAEKAVNSSEKMVKIKLYNNAISLSYYAFFMQLKRLCCLKVFLLKRIKE